MKKILFIVVIACGISCNSSVKKYGNTPINEQTFIELGGEKQYVEITGTSENDPVLLFLHGGPGWTQTPHLRYFNADLTKHMIVVAWEQSGCGKSFMNNPNPKNLSMEQVIKDAHELTLLLKKKYKKDKVFLVGFSWGSMIGLKLIEQYPEDYAAYFGVTQVVNLRKSIKLSREWIMQQAALKKDSATIHILQQLEKGDTAICKREMDCFLKQFEQLSKYGGAIYTKQSEAEIEKAETKYEDYKNYDWYKALMFSAYAMEKDLFETDLSYIKEVKLPVYFLMGRHDWNLPTSITLDYASQLKAPKKEMIWFENSGHEPLEEEADKFNQVLIERVKNQ